MCFGKRRAVLHTVSVHVKKRRVMKDGMNSEAVREHG